METLSFPTGVSRVPRDETPNCPTYDAAKAVALAKAWNDPDSSENKAISDAISRSGGNPLAVAKGQVATAKE